MEGNHISKRPCLFISSSLFISLDPSRKNPSIISEKSLPEGLLNS